MTTKQSIATADLAEGMTLAEGGNIVGFGNIKTTKRGIYREVYVTLSLGTGLIHTRKYNMAGKTTIVR